MVFEGSRRKPFCTVLLGHVSESISSFKRNARRPNQTAYLPAWGELVPRHRVYSRDVTGHGDQSESAIHAIRVGFGLISGESDWLVLAHNKKEKTHSELRMAPFPSGRDNQTGARNHPRRRKEG